MSYTLEFELPGLPRMSNISSGKSHWGHAYTEQGRWKHAVRYKVLRRIPSKPLKKFNLILTRFSSNEPDYDGLVRGFKAIVDGLRAAGVIQDDKLSNTGAWDCRWEKTSPKQGKIRVRVEELF